MKKNKIIIFRIIISFIILFSSIILEDNIKNTIKNVSICKKNVNY